MNRFMLEHLRKFAAEGMSRVDCAARLDVTYQSVCTAASKQGIGFRDAPRGTNPQRPLPIVEENRERNTAILQRYAAGESLTDIARSLGLTRERVRQLVKRTGAVMPHTLSKQQVADIIKAIGAEPMTADAAAARFGVRRNKIVTIARSARVRLVSDYEVRNVGLMPLVERVRAGESMHSLAAGNRSVETRLSWLIKKLGIPVRAHGRWRDLSHRVDMIAEGRNNNSTWDEIALSVGEFEAHKTSGANIMKWAERNCPEVFSIPVARRSKARKPRAPKPAREIAPDPTIVVLGTVRETAVANRGKATAAQIARAIGTTRNAVIGHWFRARQGQAA